MIFAPDALTIQEYHRSAPRWLSKTSLRAFEDHGPKWWKRRYVDGDASVDRQPGGAAEGLALDCLLTEGRAAFEARYVVRPSSIDLRTKDGKAWLADQGDREAIKEADFAILIDAVEAVMALPCWSDIEACQAQQTIRRDSPGLGIGLQSRPDWIDLKRGVVFDLKKTRDLSAFGRQAINLGYHLQAAVCGWCLAGDRIPLEHAYLVAVEWEPCPRARCFEIPHPVLSAADKRMREISAQIAHRLAADNWTDIQPDPEPLAIPEWMMRQMENA